MQDCLKALPTVRMPRCNLQVVGALADVARFAGAPHRSQASAPILSLCPQAKPGFLGFASASTWAAAKVKLNQLFPEESQRGKVRARLDSLPLAARLEMFKETDGCVRATLLSLADKGAKEARI